MFNQNTLAMKKSLLAICFIFCLHALYAQSLPDFKLIKLETKEDYNESANTAALIAADFLLNTAVNKKDINRLLCTQYIIRWMTGTPDYNFELGGKLTKMAKNNDDVFIIAMAGMTKYALENKQVNGKDSKTLMLNGMKHFAEYAANEKSGLKLNGEIKKMLEAYKAGRLEEYLKD